MRWWWQRSRPADEPAVDAPAAARDERLSAYLDGELPSDELAVVELELDRDGELRAALEGMRQVRDGLQALGEVPAPRSFALNAPVPPLPGRASRWELATRFGATAAAVALVVAVAAPELTGGGARFDKADSTASTVESALSDSARATEQFATPQLAAEAPVARDDQAPTAGAAATEDGQGAATQEAAAPAPGLAAPSVTPSAALAGDLPPGTGGATETAAASPPPPDTAAADADPGGAAAGGVAAPETAPAEATQPETAATAPPEARAPETAATTSGEAPQLQPPAVETATVADEPLQRLDAQAEAGSSVDGGGEFNAVQLTLALLTALLVAAATAMWRHRRRGI